MADLVFTSAGDHHNLAQWSGPDRDYEIYVCYYGTRRFENLHPVDVVDNRFTGSKFQNLKAAYERDRTYFARFTSIFVVDDDIEISARDINELFAIRQRLDLNILQPSQDRTGKFSYPTLLTFEGCFGRLTNFCEVCVPLFETKTLLAFLEEYDGSLAGWGIDWWYSHRVSRSYGGKIAVIDSVSCRNPFESEKGLTVREIDRYQDATTRRAAWEQRRSALGWTGAAGFNEYVTVAGQLDDLKQPVQESPGPSPVRISVVVEWENALLSDKARIPLLFSGLVREIGMLDEPTELLVMYNPDVVDGGALGRLLAENALEEANGVTLRLLSASGEHYYDLKNKGVLAATGEIVVFADSDVEPEPNWLRSLVAHLDASSDLGMVGGWTYIKPAGPVGKAFSAGWFFPLRPRDGTLVESPARFLWSNNCAYRRNSFLAHPYRASQFNETRGACGRQLVEMNTHGVTTANISSAVVSHPAPNGLKHFVTRALAEGRDRSVDLLLADGTLSRRRSFARLARFAARKIKQTLHNSVFERQRLDASLIEAPILVSIMATYYALLLCGALRTLVSPDSARNKWRI